MEIEYTNNKQEIERLKKLFCCQNSRNEFKINAFNHFFLKDKQNNKTIPLVSIEYELEIIDSLAYVSLTQTYLNEKNKALGEVEYSFSLSENSCFYEFQAQLDEKIIKGQIKEKQEAKAEYEQKKAQGQTVAYSEINDEVSDVIKVDIGNFPPNKALKIVFRFIKEMDIYANKFLKLIIPSTLTPRYNPEENKFKSAHQPNIITTESPTYSWKIAGKIISSSEINFLKSPSHEIKIKNLDNSKQNCYFEFSNKEIPNKDFVLLYSNSSIQKNSIVLGYCEKNEKMPYCAMIDYLPNFNSESEDDAFNAFKKDSVKNDFKIDFSNASGEFIFLLDKSGSMSGSRMNLALQALTLFFRSLPFDSYYNLFCFDSSFSQMYPESVYNNEENLQKTLNSLGNISATGGTEIYQPLCSALNSKKINHYPKSIFILTDGDVGNVNEILGLIAKENELTRIYTIGIGNGCSREIIVEGAKIGKGKHEFINDGENMNGKIIGLLKDSITPFLSNFKLSYDEKLVEIIAPYPNSIEFIRKNEMLKFFIFLKKEFGNLLATSLKLEYYDSILKKNIVNEIQINLTDNLMKNDYLHKYGAFKFIKTLNRSLNFSRNINDDVFLAQKGNLDGYCLDLALKYQLLTIFTSFICIIDEKGVNQRLIQAEKIIIPSIQSSDYEDSGIYRNFSACQSRCAPKKWSAPSSACQIFDASILSQKSQSRTIGCDSSALFSHQFLAAPQKKSEKSGGLFGNSMNSEKMKKKSYEKEESSLKGKGWFEKLFGSSNNDLKMDKSAQPFVKDNIAVGNAPSKAVERSYERGQNPGFNQNEPSFINLSPLMTIIGNQKIQGNWELTQSVCNSINKKKELIEANIPLSEFKNNENLMRNIWITALVLFFLETYHSNDPSCSLIIQKGESFISKNFGNLQILKDHAKSFFQEKYNYRRINQALRLNKNCNTCKGLLVYTTKIMAYGPNNFQCDKCNGTHLVEGGVYHCEKCQFDLCYQCNNEVEVFCKECKSEKLTWMTKIPNYQGNTYFCDECRSEREINGGVYHCQKCGNFDLCFACKSFH